MLSQRTEPWAVAPARVVDLRDETPGVTTYRIELSEAADRRAYHAQPGQFNMLYLPGVGESAISLSHLAVPGEPIVHTIRAVGNVTHALARLTPGDSLGVRGPFGSHWPMTIARGQDLVVVAGGIGLAPLRPVIEHVIQHREEFGRVILLIGSRTPEDLLYSGEYANWQSLGIELQATVDRATATWKQNVGVVTLLLNRLSISAPQQTCLFCCGPEVMMNYAIRAIRQHGVPRENVWLSLERNMSCAIGHCGRCQFGPHFICKEGPVMRYDQVNRLLRVDSL